VFNAAAEMVGQVLVELRLVRGVDHDARKHLQLASRGLIVMGADGIFWQCFSGDFFRRGWFCYCLLLSSMVGSARRFASWRTLKNGPSTSNEKKNEEGATNSVVSFLLLKCYLSDFYPSFPLDVMIKQSLPR
jgi:hypothetical protein